MVKEPPHMASDAMTDVELVQASLRDADAFYFLMKRYEPRILRYIHRMTTIGKEASADLLQEIFIKIYRNLNGFNPERKFSTWAYRIAHNEIISHHRRQKHRPVLLTRDDPRDEERPLIEFLSDTLDVQEIYLSREIGLKVRAALGELPPKYSEILVLRYFEEMSYKEIGEILRKPAGSVATLISRAKAKFKKIARRHQLDGV